jgi:uncharacterized protein with WD repeat
MDTSSILKDLRTERDRIDRAIAALEGLGGTGMVAATPGAQPASVKPRGRRRMSAAGRKKIAEAQRKRWAAQKKDAPAPMGTSAKKSAPARHMSPATKKRLSQLAKARWAARKKAAKAA